MTASHALPPLPLPSPFSKVVSVCWDAIDGSTLFELISSASTNVSISGDSGSLSLNSAEEASARFLMAFWFLRY